MRRLFWLTMGITIGALIVRKLSSAAQRLTPGNLAGNLTEALRDAADAVREFSLDVRAAMAEREAELRAGTALDGQLGRVDTPDGADNAGTE
jgi:hypothetical protein